jgi:hypothetical protein
VNLHVKSGRDDTALVQAAIKFDDDSLGAVIVDDLKFTNIACVAVNRKGNINMCVRRCCRWKGGTFT